MFCNPMRKISYFHEIDAGDFFDFLCFKCILKWDFDVIFIATMYDLTLLKYNSCIVQGVGWVLRSK